MINCLKISLIKRKTILLTMGMVMAMTVAVLKDAAKMVLHYRESVNIEGPFEMEVGKELEIKK